MKLYCAHLRYLHKFDDSITNKLMIIFDLNVNYINNRFRVVKIHLQIIDTLVGSIGIIKQH